MAIFEFSSSNGFSSFNINFECRDIRMIEIEDENNTLSNHFTYLVNLPNYLRSNTSCDERGYEEWQIDYRWCITTFEG